jgi:hypothetical protein
LYEYPSIPGPSKAPHKPCMGFVKYDGSNLRGEWTPKRGFHKFGTRDRRFDHSDKDFGPSIPIFMKSLAEPLEQIFKRSKKYRNLQRITVFFEYFGPKSIVGVHTGNLPSDEMKCVLFDVALDKFGLLGPRDFFNDFCHLPNTAECIYQGNLNQSLIDSVRNGEFNINEGVVCKGGSGGNDWWACKIKTNAYLDRIKGLYETGWEKFWE